MTGIRMVILIAVIQIVFLSKAMAKEESNENGGHEIGAEEYSVYTALIENIATTRWMSMCYRRPDIMVIMADTSPEHIDEREYRSHDRDGNIVETWYIRPQLNMPEGAKAVFKETIRDYNAKNSKSHRLHNFFKPKYFRLSNLFNPKVECVLLSKEERGTIFKSGGWGEFHEKYPDSQGIIHFSRVGFNPEHDRALVWLSNMCNVGGAGLGVTQFVFLFKRYGVWSVKYKFVDSVT